MTVIDDDIEAKVLKSLLPFLNKKRKEAKESQSKGIFQTDFEEGWNEGAEDAYDEVIREIERRIKND